MTSNAIQYSEGRDLALESVLALYRANEWSSAQKPELLHKALLASHALFTALHGVGRNETRWTCPTIYWHYQEQSHDW